MGEPEPTYVDDATYKTMLLQLLDIGDPADSAYWKSIEELEALCVASGLTLPIVRRIVPENVAKPEAGLENAPVADDA